MSHTPLTPILNDVSHCRKRDSYRIWQNLLNVATTISPPPYDDIIIAQQRIIELRSSTEGEGCVDLEVMEGLLSHVIAIASEKPKLQNNGTEDGGQPKRRYGLEAMFTDLVQKHIVPLITHSRRLWQLVAQLSIHQNMPSTALDAYEKAWRVTLNKPGWDDGSAAASSNAADADTPEQVWQAVVDSTIELIDAYESLGDKEVTEGLGAGTGQLVAQNWRYKARVAVRSVTGRRSKTGLEDFEQLQARMAELKSG